MEYLKEGENIASAGVFYAGDLTRPIDSDLYTKRPPLYPIFIAVVKSFFPYTNAVLAAQVAVYLLSLLGFLKLLRVLKVTLQWQTAVALVILFCVTPSQYLYPSFIMSETVFLFLLLAATLCISCYLTRNREIFLYAYQAFIMLGMLTKPVLYLFVLPNLIFCFWISMQRRTARPALASILPVVFVFAFCSWNEQRTGYFQFSSIQNLNLVQYMMPLVVAKAERNEAADTELKRVLDAGSAIPDYALSQKTMLKKAVAIIRRHPLQYLSLQVQGMVNFFLDPGRFELYRFLSLDEPNADGLLQRYKVSGYRGVFAYLQAQHPGLRLLLLTVVLGNVIKAAGCVYFAIAKFQKSVKGFVLLLILFVAAATGPTGCSRFAAPVFPLMLLCCAISMQHFLGRNGGPEGPAPRTA
ncbi:MAG: hypothetical protein ABIW76_03360 [Fibrobacteria bacterium]